MARPMDIDSIAASSAGTTTGMPLTDMVSLDMDILTGTTKDLSYAGKPKLLLIAVKICGKAARAMIDCGSTRDFVDEDYAIRNGLKFTRLDGTASNMTSLQVQLVNNNVLSVDYKVAKCPVKYRNNFSEHRDFYVLPLHGKFDIILGQPFLQSRNPDIDWVRKTVTMSKMHKEQGRAEVLRSVVCTSMHVLPSLITSSQYVYKQPAEDSERTKK